MHAVIEPIRRVELEAAWRSVSGPSQVLELGGASGYQASLLQQWGHEVTSVDVEVPDEALHFPVRRYDGRKLPFPDAAFDVVFSSNVLEHVEDVPGLLAESARVLRPGGVMIHVLPGTSFRFWTSVAHYPWVVLMVFSRRRRRSEVATFRSGRAVAGRSLAHLAWRAAIPQAHGVYPNALSELYTYSAPRWRRLFERCGMRVETVEPAGVFYSGYNVLGKLGIRARTRLAALLGSACNIFILRPGA